MKAINIPMEDEVYKTLSELKGNRTWYQFILYIIEILKEVDKD